MLYSVGNKHPGRKMSNRSIAQTVGLDKTTVNKYIKLAEKDPEGITGLLAMDEREMERHLCGGNPAYTDARFVDMSDRMEYFTTELGRKHMTSKQLYEEYKENNPNGYSYSQFCFHLQQHMAAKSPTLSLVNKHEGGLKMYADKMQFSKSTPFS